MIPNRSDYYETITHKLRYHKYICPNDDQWLTRKLEAISDEHLVLLKDYLLYGIPNTINALLDT